MAGLREPLGAHADTGWVKIGPFINSVDGKTLMTGLTIAYTDVLLSKNNADYAAKNDASSAIHDENGWYDIPLNASDLDTTGYMDIFIKVEGALAVKRKFKTVAAVPEELPA